MQRISFENCSSRILNNKSLETLLPECPNLKSLSITGSDRLGPKTIAKIPSLRPRLKEMEIKNCADQR
jgi:hypothetical protein